MVEANNISGLLRQKGLTSLGANPRGKQSKSNSACSFNPKISLHSSEAFAGALKATDSDMLQYIDDTASEVFGSRVASPSMDRYNNWSKLGLTNESHLLYSAYIKVRELFGETTLDASNKRLTRAVGKGFTHEFTPAYQTDESRAYADWANNLTKPVAEMIIGSGWAGGTTDYMKGQARPITIADISEQLGRYCNYPIILDFYKSGGLKKLIPMPPYTWVINSDENFLWRDPKAAYIQYDPVTGQEVPNGRIHTKNMVWLSANHDPDQRYGFPFAYNAAVFVDSFRALVDGLEEARDNANPEKVYLAPGKDGRGFSEDERKKLQNTFPKRQQGRGKKLRAFDFYRLLNGVADAKVLSIGTDFFNQLGDADLFRQHIAMIYGISVAIVLGQATFNRATLELLLRMESGARRLWAAHLALVGIFPVFQRVLDSADIPTDQVNCELVWNEEKTPEEMSAEAAFAKESWLDGLIAEESAHIKVCNYLSINPKVDEHRKEQEGKAGKQPPDQNRQTLRVSGLNPNQPLSLLGLDRPSTLNSGSPSSSNNNTNTTHSNM